MPSLSVMLYIGLALLVVIGGGGYLDHTLSYSAGAASRDAQCTTDRAADKATYLGAQTLAVSKAADAQKQVDKEELDQTKKMLGDAQQAALTAQSNADTASAKADTLTANLTRLKNENKDVNTWSDACLPSALLVSLQNGSRQATGSTCR